MGYINLYIIFNNIFRRSDGRGSARRGRRASARRGSIQEPRSFMRGTPLASYHRKGTVPSPRPVPEQLFIKRKYLNDERWRGK